METTSGRLNVVKDEQVSYFQVRFAPIRSRGGSAWGATLDEQVLSKLLADCGLGNEAPIVSENYDISDIPLAIFSEITDLQKRTAFATR